MRSHQLSTSRRFNRHWQSSGGGKGGLPPVPVYPSFADFGANLLCIGLNCLDPSGVNQVNFHPLNYYGMFLFLDENKIFFNQYYYNFWNIDAKIILPKNLEIQLKDKVYFNSDDLYAQYPTGFHNITMKTTTLRFYGEDIEVYEIDLTTGHNFEDYYIEYDMERANINNMIVDGYVMNLVDNAASKYYFDTWSLTGHPVPSPKSSNLKYQNSVNGLIVRNPGHPIYPNALTGIYFPSYLISTFWSTYDLNDLFDSSGDFNFTLGSEYVFFLGNFSNTFTGVGTPAFNSLSLSADNLEVGYWDSGNYYYYMTYDGMDVDGGYYMTHFIVDAETEETVLSEVDIRSNY